jgi:hypothetical protein
MATTRQIRTNNAVATRPFYAAVGAGDLAVALARTAANDVQTRLAKVDLQPQTLQKEALALPTRVESLVNTYLAELNETVETINAQYVDLALRGKHLVTRIRRQQATQDAVAETKKTVSKAKTTRTQAKKATSTATSSAKATGTSARKAASAASKATSDAASKTGN